MVLSQLEWLHLSLAYSIFPPQSLRTYHITLFKDILVSFQETLKNILGLYRSGSYPCSTFFNILGNFLNSILPSNIIQFEFNISRHSLAFSSFLNLSNFFSVNQNLSMPTHIQGNTIDFIISFFLLNLHFVIQLI